MRKKIGIMLCICFLMGVVSGCGAEESELAEERNSAIFEESSEPQKVDAAELNQEQTKQPETKQAEAEQKETEQRENEVTFSLYEIEYHVDDEVPELMDYSRYIHDKSDGQAYLQVERNIWTTDALYRDGVLLGDYYDIHVSDVWPDRVENEIWFYVRDDLGDVMCREADAEEPCTLEEWRGSIGYETRMKAVLEWQKERMKLLLASEGEPLDEPWYEAYRSVVMDWSLIEDFDDPGDSIGPIRGEGNDYNSWLFDAYWLCDIDRNGTPELFLYSDTRILKDVIVILTYTDHPVVVDFYSQPIYGVNMETGEIIIHGHWKGAGGTGVYGNEWSAYKIQGDTAEYSFYIDSYVDFTESEYPYRVYYPERHDYEWQADGREYEEIYAAHVANCIPVEDIVKYDLNDLSGLKDIR